MLSTTILVSLLVTSHAWFLHTTVNEITPGRTENVRLICQADDSKNEKSKIHRLLQMRVIKLNSFCTKETLAEVQFNTNYTFIADKDANISSSVDTKGTPFLEIWWPMATKNTAGAYECEINGYSVNDDFVRMKTPPARIKEKILTIHDVQKLIESTVETFKKKLDDLEKENAHLKNFISREFDKLRKEVTGQKVEYSSEISQLKRYIGDDYVNMDNLESTILMLKNFTLNEIMSDNLEDDKIHDQLYDKIKEVKKNSQANHSKMESANENLRSELNGQLRQIDQIHRKSLQKMESHVTKITSTIANINAKYQNITDDLEIKVDLCSPPTARPKRTDYVTTPSPFRTHRPKPTVDDKDHVVLTRHTNPPKTSPPTNWPEGNFALPKPPTECPNPREYSQNGRNLFTVSSFEIYNIDPSGTNHKYVSVMDSSGSVPHEAKLCSVTDSNRAKRPSLWPLGSYCINQRPDKKCPQGFKSGFTFFRGTKDRIYVNEYLTLFCCRSDGNATNPIQLPMENAFNLYRKGGTCQKVKGMEVKASGNIFMAFSSDMEISTSLSGSYPDVNSQRTNIRLCQYTPKHQSK